MALEGSTMACAERHRRVRGLVQELGAIALLLLASLFACPWAWDSSRAIPRQDTAFTLVALRHLQDAVLSGADWREAPLAFPLPLGTTRADWVLGQALLGLPLRPLLESPARLHAILAFLGIFLTAWACSRLARALLGPGLHTLAAGIVGALGPLTLNHAAHLNLVHHELLLLGVLGLGVGVARGRPWISLLGGLGLCLSAHFGAYIGLHALLVTLALLPCAWLHRRGSLRPLAMGALGLLLALATLIPVLSLYAQAAERFGVAFSTESISAESWDLADTLRPLPSIPLHRAIASALEIPLARGTSDQPNPGYIGLALGLSGLLALGLRGLRRPAWASLLLVMLLSGLLALGPLLIYDGQALAHGPYALLEGLPGFQALRAPARWLMLGGLGLGLLASVGIQRLRRAFPGRAGAVVALSLTLLPLIEQVEVETLPSRAVEPAAVYRALRDLPIPGALVERWGEGHGRCACTPTQRFYAMAVHGRALTGGHYARGFSVLEELNREIREWPSLEARELLRLLGVRLILEHPPFLSSPPPDVEVREVEGHRILILPASPPPHAPQELQESPAVGPVLGLRWEHPPREESFDLRCAEAAPERVLTRPWRLLAEIRHGPSASPFDVLLGEPCDTLPAGAPLGARGLHGRSSRR